jgi:hypothetical protein
LLNSIKILFFIFKGWFTPLKQVLLFPCKKLSTLST